MFYGPAYWRFMHHFALHDTGRDLMDELGQFIGCEVCAAEYEPPQTPDTDLVTWSKDLHNKVNAKLGKWDKWDMIDFNIGQKPDCDLCSQRDDTRYPWMFIHNVAEAGGNTASVPFLQKFDQAYPCDVHRGTFLTDPPQDGESAIDWTIRNHRRTQPDFEYYPKPANANGNQQGTNDCVGCPSSSV